MPTSIIYKSIKSRIQKNISETSNIKAGEGRQGSSTRYWIDHFLGKEREKVAGEGPDWIGRFGNGWEWHICVYDCVFISLPFQIMNSINTSTAASFGLCCEPHCKFYVNFKWLHLLCC